MPRALQVFTFFAALVAFASGALADKRVALVIGNASYEKIPALRNAKNDAEAVAATLDRLGFKVVKGTDLSHEAFAKTVRDFSRELSGADAAVLFYAGHGLRVNDRNYLAPVDAKLESEADLDFEMVQLETILTQMEREPRINIVLLDACRDNPLAKNLSRSMGTRSAAIGRGLARVKTGIGTLIAFATQPDNVALDGDGEHSPFTAALLKHMETPGLDIALLMREVRQEVIAATSGKQVPWDHSSLTTNFEFNPAGAVAAPTGTTPPLQAPAPPVAPKIAALPPPESPNQTASSDWPVWVKLCMKNENTGNKRVCLVDSETLDPDTGAVLLAVAVRMAEGEKKQTLLVRVPTANSLSVPPGLRVRIDDDELAPLQYAVCFPTSCQVQLDVTADLLEKMRKGKQMRVTMITSDEKTRVLPPVPLGSFNKVYDGASMDSALYEQSRRKMMERYARRETASLEPDTLFPGAEGKALAAEIAATRTSRRSGSAAQPKAAATSDGNSSWVKLCMTSDQSHDQPTCYIHHEGIVPETGMVLVSAQVRTSGHEGKRQLLVGLPTAYSLVMSAGVQIKIDEGEPIALQYSNCFPDICQVEMELTQDLFDKVRKGADDRRCHEHAAENHGFPCAAQRIQQGLRRCSC